MKTTKRKRLATYRKALKHLEEGVPKFGMMGFGLCLVLPCIYYGLEHKSHCLPDGKRWRWQQTANAFPELKDIIEQLMLIEPNTVKEGEERDALRIKLLKEYLYVNN